MQRLSATTIFGLGSLLFGFVLLCCTSQATAADSESAPTGSAGAATAASSGTDTEVSESQQEETDEVEAELPWEYSPYRVLIWIASRDPRYKADVLRKDVVEYLDRDFFSLWRTTIEDAPASVETAAFRSMHDLSYDKIAASDPVIAVKRDHDDAVRIQSVLSVKNYLSGVLTTGGMRADVLRRAAEAGRPDLRGAAGKLVEFDGDGLALADAWKLDSTEAVMVNRGMAGSLEEPAAKMLSLPITGLVSTAVESYDKIFVVRIEETATGGTVAVAEMETLMRYFGDVASESFISSTDLPSVVGHCVTEAFAPMVRIEEAGTKQATGLIRAGRLIQDPESPALIPVGSALLPMLRKNDRSGNPIGIGRIEWAYLIATEAEGPLVKMDYYTGRPGGLQGRNNDRTFKMGMLVKPKSDSTTLRLHAKDEPDEPLIGYELYERELKSKSMTFVGRTNWDGRLEIKRTEDPMRLLYVKNGGAVLARLPMVPGFTETEVADLTGDDLRLQAEAYIRGVQNAIVDLVAIRKLLAARIRMRLRNGQMEQAEELLESLRTQPTNEELANDMGKKQALFIKELSSRQIAQRRKIDDMFAKTREMLGKQINPAIIRDLESDVLKAKENGGKLPPQQESSDADAS